MTPSLFKFFFFKLRKTLRFQWLYVYHSFLISSIYPWGLPMTLPVFQNQFCDKFKYLFNHISKVSARSRAAITRIGAILKFLEARTNFSNFIEFDGVLGNRNLCATIPYKDNQSSKSRSVLDLWLGKKTLWGFIRFIICHY